jgi:hypothetical protein
MNHHSTVDTSNDESIARAIAAADQEALDAQLAGRMDNDVFTYPGQRRRSAATEIQIPRGRIVGVDDHHHRGGVAMPSNNATLPLPPLSMTRTRVRMCHVPCVVGDHMCVEMMVDTGAEASVISLQLARELGLEKNVDRRESGIATGVGKARILGKIRNVICTLGHVEFHMEFMVLDVPGRMLLLGMDQMRKYNCIIDLQRDVLIFGGSGGVEVPLLPPEQQPSYDVRLGEACTIS